MALLDNGRPPRDILPPINRPDFDKHKPEKTDHLRFSTMPGLSVSTAPLGSPTTVYSGPPPPYSRTSSTTESAPVFSGYFSPPLSSTRHSIRDEKDLPSAKTLPSLPSLHEALGRDKPGPLPGPPSATQPQGIPSTPATTVGQTFAEATRGPPNPFAPTAPPPPLTATYTQPDALSSRAATMTNTGPEQASHSHQAYLSSPQTTSNNHRSSGGSFSSLSRPFDHSNPPFQSEPSTQGTQYRDYPNQPPAPQSHPSTSFNFEPTVKFDETRNPFARNNVQPSYGETVKRHLEGFDAELALNEITDISLCTSDFSRSWAQRYHQSNRMSYFADSAPSIQDIDEMMRQQQRILDNLTRLREVVVVQQNALTEQRARNARNHYDDEYHALHEEYRAGGFAGGDAKKRRGKAAPPGRCHSCNRAETPEWRRGPDGARTLCNACGLHYAKLTRKLGANKASALTGSNLRPKGLDSRPTHV